MSVDLEKSNITEASDLSIDIRVVPWYNAAQFKKVFEFLYSDELVKKKWAYDTISVWETRCHPSLPTAIEATYVLTSAVIQDILWTNKASLIHYTDLQSIYGSAVTRFVSLTVEVNKDGAAQSVASVAKSIGIPSFIVDLRNEWSHSNRPSLSVLRLAAQAALKYLKESYWEKEAARVRDYVKPLPVEAGLKNLFKMYIDLKFYILSSAKEKNLQNNDEMVMKNSDLNILMHKFESCLKINRHFFVKTLALDDVFVPIEKDLMNMVSPEEFSLFGAECDMEYDNVDDEDEYKLCMNDYEKKVLPEIPKCHAALWEPIIFLLHRYDAVAFFMECLLRSLGDRTVANQKLIIAWILKILRIHSSCASVEMSVNLKRIFRKKGIVADWRAMFYAAVVNPCKYSPLVIPLILNHVNLKKNVTLRVLTLLAIYIGLNKDDKPGMKKFESYKKFHTVDDLKRVLEYQRNKRRGKSLESIWSPCPDDCHKSWPIGFIINAVEDEENEEDIVEDDFLGIGTEQLDVVERCLPHNENDNDDDQMDEPDEELYIEPNMEKIMLEIKSRNGLLYKK